MQIHAMLDQRRAEILTELEKLQAELAEIDRMLGVTGGTTKVKKTTTAIPVLPVPETKDDAILQAIEAGNKTPATISEWMREKMGADVNDASTRTRLSRMKAAGKIGRDGNGWKLI